MHENHWTLLCERAHFALKATKARCLNFENSAVAHHICHKTRKRHLELSVTTTVMLLECGMQGTLI